MPDDDTTPRLDPSASAPTSRSQLLFGLAAGVRVAALVASVIIAIAWSVTRGMGLSALLWPLGAYLVVSLVAFAFRRRPFVARLAGVFPYLDTALAFAVHHQGLHVDRMAAGAWAGWCLSSLAASILILVLAALSSPGRTMVVLTPLVLGSEALFLHSAGLLAWPIAISLLALAVVARVTTAVPRAAFTSAKREEEAALTRDALAKERQQNQKLELVQREKEAFLETIVHDMRSPVGAALLSIEYLAIELKREGRSAPLLEATDDALATLNSLSRLIAQILDMSKLESGRLTLRFDLEPLRPIVEEAISEALPRARNRFIAIDQQAPENLKAVIDVRLLSRTLDALLTYAIRHTPEHGRILVLAAQGPHEARLSIHTTMPALPADERRRLFERLPLAGAEPRRLPTWGVGLYFCRLVAEAHQGSIAMEDVDGWPTSIVLHLLTAS